MALRLHHWHKYSLAWCRCCSLRLQDVIPYEHTCKQLRDDLPVPSYGFLLGLGRFVIVQEQKQEWALNSSRLELSQAAAWDTRTEHFYTVAAVQPGAAKVTEKGLQHRLLGWPASYSGVLEDAPLSMELHGAVHAAHPIYPAASAASAKDSPSEQTQKDEAGQEQHNSSSAAERGLCQNTSAPQKQKVGPLTCYPSFPGGMDAPAPSASVMAPGTNLKALASLLTHMWHPESPSRHAQPNPSVQQM